MGAELFRRYTTLPFALDILYHKRLPLLDPKRWEDKNDAYFMELYKEKKNLNTLLAICFAKSPEKYQHWKIYSGDSSGVCIEFDQFRLLERLENKAGFRKGDVTYPYIDNLERDVPLIDDLPFIKRYPFQDEREYRVIFEDEKKEIPVTYMQIDPRDVLRIVINPWVNKSVFESVRSVIRSIDGFKRTTVFQSTVLENEKWKKIGKQAFKSKKGQLFQLTEDNIKIVEGK